ncbi:Flp family type IVb pilin [Rhizobium sp. RU36D]|uniref:Flp family type IVb pilin n=1 Tax=Rhizobium sp. RU36D TaxID=1907415 RepID=UPI0009D90753|nr:Flp family type IVb pilin [Rhizobium sp. RU36D]SMC78284.1 pilus assembly protein Flp/PilA [Rhizobium sp. RU36D]
MRLLNRLLADTSGATAIEYGLIAALISLALVTGFTAFTGSLANIFTDVNTSINSAGQ